MNPQKYCQHTALNHSLLWRKSYSFEKPDLDYKPPCHKQLNPLAQTGQSWRTRNNFIQTNFSQIKNNSNFNSQLSMKKSLSLSRVNNVLQNQKSETRKTQELKKSLIVNADVLERSVKLIEGMEQLRDMRLLSNKDLQRIKYPGIIRHSHVHNDYHERVTNPGFSRNVAGKHFTK